eukprot:jgi/Tetstr1/446172/TSEL_003573.t1
MNYGAEQAALHLCWIPSAVKAIDGASSESRRECNGALTPIHSRGRGTAVYLTPYRIVLNSNSVVFKLRGSMLLVTTLNAGRESSASGTSMACRTHDPPLLVSLCLEAGAIGVCEEAMKPYRNSCMLCGKDVGHTTEE